MLFKHNLNYQNKHSVFYQIYWKNWNLVVTFYDNYHLTIITIFKVICYDTGVILDVYFSSQVDLAQKV